MSHLTEQDVVVLRRLAEKAEADPDFNAEEKEIIKKFVKAVNGLIGLGRFAKWVVFILAAIAGAITAIDQILVKVRLWLGV